MTENETKAPDSDTPRRSGEVYECPADGCGRIFPTANELRGHMAGTMQSDDSHEWNNVPISHNDLSNARVETTGLGDF